MKQRFLYNLIISVIIMCLCAVFFPIGEGKVHLPNCKAAETISGNNKKYVIATKEYLNQSGFEKCFSCNPY